MQYALRQQESIDSSDEPMTCSQREKVLALFPCFILFMCTHYNASVLPVETLRDSTKRARSVNNDRSLLSSRDYEPEMTRSRRRRRDGEDACASDAIMTEIFGYVRPRVRALISLVRRIFSGFNLLVPIVVNSQKRFSAK